MLVFLYSTAIKSLMFLKKYHYILLTIHSIAISISWASPTFVLFILLMQLENGSEVLNISFFISIFSRCSSWVWNCYNFFDMYICIPKITWTWPYHWSLKFNTTIGIIHSPWFIIYFNSIYCSKFRWLIWCIV